MGCNVLVRWWWVATVMVCGYFNVSAKDEAAGKKPDATAAPAASTQPSAAPAPVTPVKPAATANDHPTLKIENPSFQTPPPAGAAGSGVSPAIQHELSSPKNPLQSPLAFHKSPSDPALACTYRIGLVRTRLII